jgi:hypothetical protein
MLAGSKDPSSLYCALNKTGKVFQPGLSPDFRVLLHLTVCNERTDRDRRGFLGKIALVGSVLVSSPSLPAKAEEDKDLPLLLRYKSPIF